MGERVKCRGWREGRREREALSREEGETPVAVKEEVVLVCSGARSVTTIITNIHTTTDLLPDDISI